jgi:hypothetical protein
MELQSLSDQLEGSEGMRKTDERNPRKSRKTSGVDGLLNEFSGHCSHPTGYGPAIKRRKP